MGKELMMFNGLPSDLPNGVGADIAYTVNEINTERGMIKGGAAVWNADGGNQNKKRGAILAKRLALINEFNVRLRGKEVPFGAFMKRKGVNENMFMAELPGDLQFVGISNELPASDRLMAYGAALNREYATQYLEHVVSSESDSLSCDGGECKCGMSADGDGAAKVTCNLRYPPPRTGKRKDAYNACLKTEAVKILQKREDKKAAGVGGLGNVMGVVNKANPALVLTRNGFLGLTRLNALNLATNLGRMKAAGGQHWNKVVKKWIILGGDLNSIRAAVDAGKNKKPIFAKKSMSADGWESGSTGDGWASAEGDVAKLAGLTAAVTAVGGPAAGAWAASASGTIAAFLPLIDSFKTSKGEKLTADENPSLPGLNDPELNAALAAVDAEKNTPAPTQSFMDKYKFWVVGSMVLISGITIIALTAGGKKA